MGGGLMQLVAYGAQDIYLTGNPQITFFKVVYRRHTNFSMETIQQTINGISSVTNGANGTVTISRNGDLVSKVYVTTTVATTDGSNIISQVECEIGGQLIDRQYQEWNDIWNELSIPESKAFGFKSMQLADGGTIDTTGVGLVQVPLNFWFCRNPGLALPLIALQYHEVKLKFTWGSGGGTTAQVWVDYIYLDTDERRRFAQVSHEYLIEQIQKQTATATTSTKLNFNHPVKEIIWTSARTNAYTNARLVLNGHDRFADQEEEYFQLRQPFDNHTSIPKQNLPPSGKALKVEWYQNSAPSDYLLAVGRTGLDAAPFTTVGDFNQYTSAIAVSADTAAAGACKFLGFLASDWTSATDSTGTPYVQVGDVHYIAFRDAATVVTTGSRVCEFGRRAMVTSLTMASADAIAAAGYAVGEVTINAGELEDGTSATDVGDATLTIGYNIDIHNGMTGNANSSLHIQRLSSREASTSKMTKKINVYSFALKPEEHQPSGSCNFSRIDNAQLRTGSALTADDNIYAVNYNVLRIMSGMGGLAYSN
jgi:hypothetical protein